MSGPTCSGAGWQPFNWSIFSGFATLVVRLPDTRCDGWDVDTLLAFAITRTRPSETGQDGGGRRLGESTHELWLRDRRTPAIKGDHTLQAPNQYNNAPDIDRRSPSGQHPEPAAFTLFVGPPFLVSPIARNAFGKCELLVTGIRPPFGTEPVCFNKIFVVPRHPATRGLFAPTITAHHAHSSHKTTDAAVLIRASTASTVGIGSR